MATQMRLSPTFQLDRASREAGRRGVARARQALAEAVARSAADARTDGPHLDEHHAHAA